MTILVILYFAITTSGFLSGSNIQNIFANSALPVIVAIGLTLCLVMGEYDLSIEAAAGLGTILFAVLVSNDGMNTVLAILVCLAVGVTIGAINGVLVAYVGLAALVATIAMQSLLNGMQFYVSNNAQVYGGFPHQLTQFTRGNAGPIPNLVIVAGVASLLCWVLLERTSLGRRMKAVGGNSEAARLAGVNVRRTRLAAFIICSAAAVLAGVLFSAKEAVAYPLSGLDVLLPSFTAAFIGAATFRFGEFNVWGTVVGVLITEITADGLTLKGVPNYATYVFEGLILLVALIFARAVSLRRVS